MTENDDTIILTPEERDKILEELPDDKQENNDDSEE